MGTIRTRITKKNGKSRYTISWGGKRGGITTSSSYGFGGQRTTWSSNSKTGKTYRTFSFRIAPHTWYVDRRQQSGIPALIVTLLFWAIIIAGLYFNHS